MGSKKESGKTAFEKYYSGIYGDRWEMIKESFKAEPLYHTVDDGLLSPYYIDRASLYPVLALDIKPGMNILDMCAAPGGKTLLASLKNGPAGIITANDRSSERRNRLKRVLESHLPPDLYETVRITGHDAAKWGIYEKNIYDRVLLDAPCSSERHVFNSPAHLERWSPARSRQLAERQFSMLASAFDALKPGGLLVYSTCSISPLENDRIIEKLFTKRKNLFMIKDMGNNLFPDDMLDDILMEKTGYGCSIMPDKSSKAGPIYFSLIEKYSNKHKMQEF